VVTPTALPTGFPYATDAQDHGLPNSNYPRPADLAAVRLPKSKPGVYYEVQSRGMYALTKGAGPACYGLVYLVRTTPPDRDGQAQVTVTDCPAPVPRDGVIEGARVIGHVGVAGVTGLLTDFRSEPVLYFTTGEFTTRIQAPGLTRQQLVALGDALTGLR
jgi:hypothetical protein